MAVNQKGANGIIAEYRAAHVLAENLSRSGVRISANLDHLRLLVSEAIARVANELSESQIARALNQGTSLGDYLAWALLEAPQTLGVVVDREVLSDCEVDVIPVGRATNSRDPRDLTVKIKSVDFLIDLPVSLKAYASDSTSLGSKSGRSALSRLFIGEEKVTDARFIEVFGDDGSNYLRLLYDFKKVAKEFYTSSVSKQFLDEYEARKGHRKVNNPLRRKEVGQFFEKKFGFVIEHHLAELFAKMHNYGTATLVGQIRSHFEFLEELKFILGNPQMLVLDAKCGNDGQVREVVNSLTNSVYMKLNQTLREGVSLTLQSKVLSSDIKVELSREGVYFTGLSLAIWKDGTIQYKLNSSTD